MLRPTKVDAPDGQVRDGICFHWKDFPPRAAMFARAEETSLDSLYRQGKITASVWQSCQFWAKNCGKARMDAACGKCQFVRFVEMRNHLVVMVSPDGKSAVPVVDSTTLETMAKWRVIPDPSFKQGA